MTMACFVLFSVAAVSAMIIVQRYPKFYESDADAREPRSIRLRRCLVCRTTTPHLLSVAPAPIVYIDYTSNVCGVPIHNVHTISRLCSQTPKDAATFSARSIFVSISPCSNHCPFILFFWFPLLFRVCGHNGVLQAGEGLPRGLPGPDRHRLGEPRPRGAGRVRHRQRKSRRVSGIQAFVLGACALASYISSCFDALLFRVNLAFSPSCVC